MKERIVYIDWLKIIAALMVVMIHTSGMLYINNSEHSLSYLLGFWNAEIVRSAVPIFFMISGALLLRPGYDAHPRKMVRKALKVLVLMLIWSFVYAIVNVHPMTLKGLVFATIKGHFHFWFFEYLIGLYLLTPLFKALADYKDGLLVHYYLALFAFFGIAVASLQALPFGHKWIMDVTTKVRFEWLGFAGYFFLGHYLNQKQIKISPWLFIGAFSVAVLLQGFIFTNMGLLYSSDKFWWLTIIEAASLFILFKNIDWQRMAWGGAKLLSSLVMGIYILHPIILEAIPTDWWTASLYGADLLLVYGGALLISYVIWKIPVVGKWLLSV
ncbi:MAG: acyltransferase family protein [Paludibacteraceae bacterium]|nr:acyltransferase family protein [Paludibacteraceae bacterium]MBQ6724262.1 acyltransferase family protein [Paludibacteraceae bacterium]